MADTDITIEKGKNAGYVLVHSDGPPCQGTPVVRTANGGFHCPHCGISPSMQDTEFWAPGSVRR